MRYLFAVLVIFTLALNCSEEEPTSPVEKLFIEYEITGTEGDVLITYLYEHSYLDSTKSIPWSASFTEFSDDAIVYISAIRVYGIPGNDIQSLTATIYVNGEMYKTETAKGNNMSVKVGGWYGL